MLHAIIFEHIEPTDLIKQQANEALNHLGDYVQAGSHFSIVLDQANPKRFRALIKVHTFGKDVVSEDTNDDLYQAIHKAKDRMERQLIELRKRLIEHHHRGEPRNRSGF